MKFIKIGDTIVNVAAINSIYANDKSLTIDCTGTNYRFDCKTEMEAREALNSIYKQLE